MGEAVSIWHWLAIAWLCAGIVSEVRHYRRLVFVWWSDWLKWLPVRLLAWPIIWRIG